MGDAMSATAPKHEARMPFGSVLNTYVYRIDNHLAIAIANPKSEGWANALLLFSLTEETRDKFILLTAGLLLRLERANIKNIGPAGAIELILAPLRPWRGTADPLIKHDMVLANQLIDRWVQEGYQTE